MMETGGPGSDASPEMVALLSEDEITPSTYGATDGAIDGKPDTSAGIGIEESNAVQTGNEADTEETGINKKKDKEKKKEKSPQKAVADALKTDMAAERTFFKWLWTGLHTGAIGSFIFVTFDTDKTDPHRLIVVGFAWVVAFLLVLYGTMVYYKRRHALRTGSLDVVPRFTREHSPLVVVVALALVVGAAMVYAILGDNHSPRDAAGGASSPAGFRGF